jgi:hypothetical protein
VSTFLSCASRYHVSLQHVSGSAILQSDFASRNAAECVDPTCQICIFVKTTEESVVRQISTHDILSGATKLPFTSRAAWSSIQAECPDLRRTHAHFKQGTRPSKKVTNAKDVKRYLNVAKSHKRKRREKILKRCHHRERRLTCCPSERAVCSHPGTYHSSPSSTRWTT